MITAYAVSGTGNAEKTASNPKTSGKLFRGPRGRESKGIAGGLDRKVDST
jgi:hypothetical protein